MLPEAFHQVSAQENIWFWENVGWRIPRWLFIARPSLMSEWGEFSYFWVSILPVACIKFLLKRIYGFEEDVSWRIPRWLFSAWQSLMSEWGDFSYFWVSILPEAFHQVSSQENKWYGRRSSIQNSFVWSSLMSEWGDFSYFWVSILLEAFHQVSAQENKWFGRRCWRIPRWLFSSWPSFLSEWNIRYFSKSLFGLTHPIRLLLWGHLV